MKSIPTFILTASILTASTLLAADAPKKKAAPAEPAKKAPAEKEAAAPKAVIKITDPVAVVEGVEIKKAELDAAFSRMLAAQGIPGDKLPEEQRIMGYRMILDDMIVEKLVTKRAADVKVTDDEVKAKMEGFKTKFGSEAAFKEQVEKSGMTMDKVKENIREGMKQESWINAQINGKDEVPDSEAEDFYKKNPDQFKQPEQVRASHILITVDKDAKPEVVAEKEKAAKAIAVRVKKGEPFDKLAAELSEDPSAKQNSGDLNFFGRGQMVPEFSDAAFKMKKDEISEPVRSQFGFHVIKVTDRKEAETVTLEQAKPKLLAYLKQQKRQGEIEKVVKGLREKADVKINLPEAPKPTAPELPPAGAPAPEPAPK
ncbi:MAG: peptidylprolyl isomerase [Chthoniobacter sp.]|nr:peptidylprolyl isomerase [Chthoniobacter sp.]